MVAAKPALVRGPPSSLQTLSQSCNPLFFLGAIAARHSWVACS
ncbi:rCG29523 [Rattus norvegicus]|uniref:RCG29523 n=1 Tax=Rattus norvegicus TaxID=10116 RepID=A6K835_RAT|nr:rCG29523 [Rattus norvegicus]